MNLTRGGVGGAPYNHGASAHGVGFGVGVDAGMGIGPGFGHRLTGGGVENGAGAGAAGAGAGTGMGLEAAAERRRAVRSALEAARVPVEEMSVASSPAPDLMVMGCVRVSFPYTADTCECANEIVLSKVRQLIDSVR